MKKIITYLAIASMVSSVACHKDEPFAVSAESSKSKVYASIDDNTKTQLESTRVLWASGDKISVISHDDWLTSKPPVGKYQLDDEFAGQDNGSFTLKTGSAPVSTESNKFYAIYNASRYASFLGGKSLTATNLSGVFEMPRKQEYVEGGISDGLLSMRGFGTSLDDMKFCHMMSIMRLKLYSAGLSDVAVDSIVVDGGKSWVAGALYHNFYLYPNSNHVGNYGSVTTVANTILYDTKTKTLSNSSEAPTEFNIVIPARQYSNLCVFVYLHGGGGFTLAKSSFNMDYGKIYSMTPYCYQPSHVMISVNDSTPIPINSYMSNISGDVKITTSDGLAMAESEISLVASTLRRLSEGAVSLDLSGISIEGNVFKNWFRECNLSYMTLPSSTTSLVGSKIFPQTLASLEIPEGVTVIPNTALDGPNCEVTIPSTVINIEAGNNQTVTGFNVTTPSAYFSSDNGVLFNAEGTTLIYYPSGKTDKSYTIPAGVTQTGSNAFQYSHNLETLTIPAAVTFMYAPFSNNTSLNRIVFLGECTDVNWMTYGRDTDLDRLFSVSGGVIKCPNGCTYYSQHDVWSKLVTIKEWTIDNGTTPTTGSASIDPLDPISSPIDWQK